MTTSISTRPAAPASPPRTAPQRRIWPLLALVVVCAALPLMPFFSSSRGLTLITGIAMAAYFALSWNVAGGMTGQLSFGHSVFLAAGAYGSAVPMIELGWHPLVGAALGCVLAAALGASFAYLGGRYQLSHLTFALVTAAFSMIAFYFVRGFDSLGGAFGLTLTFDATADELYFTDDRVYYWIFLVLVVLALLTIAGIRRRRLGTRFAAVREDEDAASAIGIDVVRTKVVAMSISAAMTAVGGTMYAHYIRFIDPHQVLGFDKSLDLALPALLGGTATIVGPLVGAVVFGVIVDELGPLLPIAGGSYIVLGVLLSVIVMFMPRGIQPTAQAWWARRRSAAHEEDPA